MRVVNTCGMKIAMLFVIASVLFVNNSLNLIVLQKQVRKIMKGLTILFSVLLLMGCYKHDVGHSKRVA